MYVVYIGALYICLWQSPKSYKLSIFAIMVILTIAIIYNIIAALLFINNKEFLLVSKLDCPLKSSANLNKYMAYLSAL